jgi:ethanolaminephosphotransferase
VEKTLFLVALVLMMMTFYFAQWEEYYTGTLTLGYIGVTEAQISAMVIYLLTAALGPAWWDNMLSIAGWSVRYGSIPFIISASSMLPTAASNFKEVFAFHSQKGSGLYSALLNTVPVVAISAGFLAWAAYSPIYHTHPQAFLLAYGFLVSNLVGRIVLARVCVERFQPMQPLIAPLLVIPFLIHSPYEELFLNVYCLVAVSGYFHFALSVIRDLCDTLKIKCLSIPKKVK